MPVPINDPMPGADPRHTGQLAGLQQRQSLTDEPHQPTTLRHAGMRMVMTELLQTRYVVLLTENESGLAIRKIDLFRDGRTLDFSHWAGSKFVSLLKVSWVRKPYDSLVVKVIVPREIQGWKQEETSH